MHGSAGTHTSGLTEARCSCPSVTAMLATSCVSCSYEILPSLQYKMRSFKHTPATKSNTNATFFSLHMHRMVMVVMVVRST